MPSQKNIDAVKDIKERIDQAKSIIIADYSGLDVGSQVELRAKVSEAGGDILVAKNRLFKIAIADQVTDNQDLEAALKGQNAFVFGQDDAVAALKAAFEFAKDHTALEIKLGVLDGKVLNLEEAKALSELPTKPELIAQLIARINGPIYGLVNVIQGPTRGLVNALKAIQDKKASEAN